MASDEIADALEQIRGFTAGIKQATEVARAARIEESKKNAEEDAALEKERRAGVHGRDWQVLQERIDLKRTTETDILTGVDHSPEAEAVRRLAQKNMAEAREASDEFIEQQNESGQLEDLKRAQAELARMVAQLGQFRGDA